MKGAMIGAVGAAAVILIAFFAVTIIFSGVAHASTAIFTSNTPADGSWQRTNFEVEANFSAPTFGIETCRFTVYNGLSDTSPTYDARLCSCSSTQTRKTTVTVGSGQKCSIQGSGKCKVVLANKLCVNGNWDTGLATRTFSIDYTSPTIGTLVSFSPASPTTTDTIKFSFTASDLLSGLNPSEIKIFIDDDIVDRQCTGNAPFVCTVTTILSIGTHTFYIQVYDNAGNSAKTEKKSFTVQAATGCTSCVGDCQTTWSGCPCSSGQCTTSVGAGETSVTTGNRYCASGTCVTCQPTYTWNGADCASSGGGTSPSFTSVSISAPSIATEGQAFTVT